MSDWHAKYAAHKAHTAAVPAALTAARNAVIDFNGKPMVDGEWPIEGITCGQLRTLVAEVDRLQAALEQARKDAREEQREFQREARDIAAEARWSERESHDRGEY